MRFTSFALSTLAALVVVEAEAKKSPPESGGDGPGGLIYGGTDAAPGEYPYFVNIPGCGASLINPDTVLTAAHCNDQTGNTFWVGAYRDGSTEAGAVQRTCVSWVRHPLYNECCGLLNDWAICILDEPVDIPQDEVLLVINDDPDFAIVGEELEAMGFGSLGASFDFAGPFPDILQKTTLEGRNCGSNRPEQVCAGGEGNVNGVTDVCRGDSGGPLVRVIEQNDGPDLHYHVGLVSSGALCPAAQTGTYARTSAGASWIKEAQCDLGSEFVTDCPTPGPPTSSPTVIQCLEEQSTLSITINTDSYSEETSWVLEQYTGFRQYEEVARNGILLDNSEYVNTFCLGPGETYKWTLSDTFSDGFCFFGVCTGSYEVRLDDELFASGDDNWGAEVVLVVTGGDCIDQGDNIRVVRPDNGNGKNVNCSRVGGYLGPRPSEAEEVCAISVVDGGLIGDYCASACCFP